jgi:hypothetical protein
MGSFFIIRVDVLPGSRVVTCSSGKLYLIIDSAAQVNVIGEQERLAFGLAPAPTGNTTLFGAGGNQLHIVGGGRLSLVFHSSTELADPEV